MLASIQRIEKLTPIPNADRIETARVMGWDVVVKRGDFRPGDLCVYIEIDTLLPRTPWSEFLFKPDDGKTEYRLKTIKLRGQVSQGLVLPTDIFQQDVFPGVDVTELLGIKKYEKPLPKEMMVGGAQRAKGGFPSFIPKTDEVRIQSALELLDNLRGKPYSITLKVDGTSCTAFNWDGRFGVCSRNYELKDPTKNVTAWWRATLDKVRGWLGIRNKGRTNARTHNLDTYWKIAYEYRIMDWLPKGWAIQFEIAGPSIQKNPLGLDKITPFLFNVFDIENQEYVNPEDYPFDTHNFPFVSLLDSGSNFNLSLEELLDLAGKWKYPNGKNSEGIVVRSWDQTISFKVINNAYLLEHGE